MPKASSSTRENASKSKTLENMLIIIHKDRRIIIPRPESYTDAVNEIPQHFPNLATRSFVFTNTELDFLEEGEDVVISQAAWDDVLPCIQRLNVKETVSSDSNNDDLNLSPPASLVPALPNAPGSIAEVVENTSLESANTERRIKIQVSYFDYENDKNTKSLTYTVRPTTLVSTIRRTYAGALGLCEDSVRFTNGSSRVKDCATFAELDIKDDVFEIYAYPKQVGGKPVIYVFPPTGKTIDVQVQLDLIPRWSFSAVYPIAPIESLKSSAGHPLGQRTAWDVQASPDGTLLDKRTGVQAAYLFWEAETDLNAPRPTDTPSDSLEEIFDPPTSNLTPDNSILVPVEEIASYLDRALLAFGFHVEARTSFITYWLPSLLKYTQIALRFLPQAVYERAAPMTVTPKPDTILRIFMVFKGVIGKDARAEWDQGIARAHDDPAMWVHRIGVPIIKGEEKKGLFRVLEWGGMEVKTL